MNTISDFLNKKCVPCEGGIPPLSEEEENKHIKEVEGWSLIREGTHKIRKEFYFEDFKEAIEFVNKVADLAEEEGHHPYIYIYYNEIELELHTYAIKGLHLNDFIMAAKINEVHKE